MSLKKEHPWVKSIRNRGTLEVFNKASAWSDAVELAISSFNQLSFGVKLKAVDQERKADVVLLLATGSTHYSNYGARAQTRSDFKDDKLHGQTTTMADEQTRELMFAVIFLPGKLPDASKQQKQIVVVHEFIHACGMIAHDNVGIMNGQMVMEKDGLVELLKDKGSKPMPPIRVGAKTLAVMQTLWPGGGTKKSH
jgi:predicted Zn-dependent protease